MSTFSIDQYINEVIRLWITIDFKDISFEHNGVQILTEVSRNEANDTFIIIYADDYIVFDLDNDSNYNIYDYEIFRLISPIISDKLHEFNNIKGRDVKRFHLISKLKGI